MRHGVTMRHENTTSRTDALSFHCIHIADATPDHAQNGHPLRWAEPTLREKSQSKRMTYGATGVQVHDYSDARTRIWAVSCAKAL